MTSHELAKKLLEYPNIPVMIIEPGYHSWMYQEVSDIKPWKKFLNKAKAPDELLLLTENGPRGR